MASAVETIDSVLAREIKKREPFGCPGEEAYLNLVRTYACVTGPAWRLFKQHDITPAKYNILRILRGAKSTGEAGPHGLPSLEVADRLVTRVPDITRLVDGLVEDGLVERTRCTSDRRIVYVGITAAGLELVHRLDQPVVDLHSRTFGGMTPDELTMLNHLLVKARAGIEPAEMVEDER